MKMCINCLLMIEDHLSQCPHCGYTEGVNPMDYCHLPPRTMLNNRYILGRPLGSGGFGVTYIAWDTVLELRVAIKEYMPGELAQRTAGTVNVMVNQSANNVFLQGKRSFMDESLRLAHLGDIPGVVKIFDCFEDNYTAYIVMEFLEGETLLTRIEREKKIPCEDCIPIMVSVLEALDKVHAAGLMHRDIAPDNIMLCRDGRVTLIDFGAARHMTTRHSRSLSAVLKIGYAPAEQYYRDGNQGAWTDVYAVGATMYHALTGVIPPDAYTRANNDTLVKPSAYAHIPRNIEIAILNAMNVTVEKRTQSAHELAAQLTGEEKTRRIPDRIRQTKVTVSRKMKALLAASIAAAVAVLALIIIGVPQLIMPETQAKVPDGMSRVPAVVSMPMTEADRILSESDLRLRVSELVYDDFFERDMILYQNPVAGSVAYIGSMVDVTVSAPEETIPVPDVLGFDKNSAVSFLENAGFVVVTREEYSDTHAPDSVVEQSISSDSTAKPGSVIELVISLGPENITLDTTVEVITPKVAGMTFAQAQTELQAHGLYITKSATEYSSTVPAGQIISQNPAAGQILHQGDTVTVVVSAGKQTASVPDVRYLTEAAARQKIISANLNVSVNYEESTSVSAGLVIRQDKTAETLLEPGDTVTIWVSTGYQVTVPNCVGKTQAEAAAALTSARLAYSVTTQNSSTVPAGQVISQSIDHGKTVEQGTTVILTVSSGTNTVAVTGVSVSPTKYTMGIGDSLTLVATVKPSDATTNTVTWKSDNTSVAVVSANGIVTAKSAGTATVTATTTDGGKTASCTVTVTKTLSSISVTTPTKTVYYLGDSLNKNGLAVTSAYNDGSTADVTGKCTLSGFDSSSAGTKTVTVSYTEGGVTRNGTFTVVVSAPTITLSPTSVSLNEGESAVLTATVTPSGQTVTWNSTKSTVASVSNGTITAKSTGSATITASFVYNGASYSASCEVNVSPKVDTSMYKYEVRNGTAVITEYTGAESEIIIPNTIDGYSVTKIGEYAFMGNSSIVIVSIPNSVICIGEAAFQDCDNMTNINIPYGLTTIERNAFFNCDSLKSISIPDSVTNIGDFAFTYCYSLTDIRLPGNLSKIPEWGFTSCPISNITIPDTVTTIGDYAFYFCEHLDSIVIPDNVTGIGASAFSSCSSLQNVTLGKKLTSIGESAFCNCEKLTTIAVPNSVTSIGSGTFYGCGLLTDVLLGSGITAIADDTFYFCHSLTSIDIPEGVVSIGTNAFYCCCKLETVHIPGSINSVANNAFAECTHITKINFANGVESIGAWGFSSSNSLKYIVIPESVTFILPTAFHTPEDALIGGEYAYPYTTIMCKEDSYAQEFAANRYPVVLI